MQISQENFHTERKKVYEIFCCLLTQTRPISSWTYRNIFPSDVYFSVWVLHKNMFLMSFVRTCKNPQANIRCFLFYVGSGKLDAKFVSVDVFVNTSSVCRELRQSQVVRMWTSVNKLKFDYLQAVNCGNASECVASCFQICPKDYLSTAFLLRKCWLQPHGMVS